MSFQEPDQQGPYQPHPSDPGRPPFYGPGYPGYPGGPGRMPGGIPVPKPPLPPTVRCAFYLMLAGAVLSLVSMLVSLGSENDLRTALQKASPEITQDQLNFLVRVYVLFTVMIAVFGVGLWIWMAFANRAGGNWARITGTVFFGLDAPNVIGGVGDHSLTGLGTAVNALIWLVGLATVILIWNKASGSYYKPQMQYPAPYPAQFPPYGGVGYPQQ